MPRPRIACIMPFADEERHLPAVLDSIAAQTVARERLFLIAVDDGSRDGGPELVRAWLARTGIAGRLVQAGARSIPRALNAGVAAASADDIIVRLDAHTIYEPDYLSLVDAALDTMPGAWCVGGANTPAPGSDFDSSLAEALYTNPMGLGPAAYRRRGAGSVARRVRDVYLGAWRPGVLQRLGGFDVRWRANEDSELAARVLEAGGAIYWIPVRCRRINTRSAGAIVRQWSRYGYWRVQTLKRHPHAFHPRHAAPALALLGSVALSLTRRRGWLAALYALYALALVRSRRPGERARVTAASLVFFPLVHAGFALGTLTGALRVPPPPNEPTRSAPRST